MRRCEKGKQPIGKALAGMTRWQETWKRGLWQNGGSGS